MATRALTAPPPCTSTARSGDAAEEAPPRRRASAQATPAARTLRPTFVGFYLAYLANGDIPPLPAFGRLQTLGQLLAGVAVTVAVLAVAGDAWGATA